jgi:outer membrane lipoprotein-sorting protein
VILRGIATILVLTFAPPPALAEEAPSEDALPGKTVDEIRECVNQNQPQGTAIEEIVMRTYDRAGGERNFEAKIYWKRGEDGLSKLRMHVDAPPDLRGAAYLALEREGNVDMFAYLPELQRVRRITPRAASGSLFGSDFSYEDFQRIRDLGAHATLDQKPGGEVEGRPVYVIEATPEPGSESAYERVITSIDRDTCLPLKMEFYEGGERPRKIMQVDPSSLTREGTIWIAKRITMTDLREEGESLMELKKVTLDTEIPDREFSKGRLERRK